MYFDAEVVILGGILFSLSFLALFTMERVDAILSALSDVQRVTANNASRISDLQERVGDLEEALEDTRALIRLMASSHQRLTVVVASHITRSGDPLKKEVVYQGDVISMVEDVLNNGGGGVVARDFLNRA